MTTAPSEADVDSLAESDAAEPRAPTERKSVAFEVKAVSSDGSGGFEGLAAAFFNIDNVGDIIDKGAFAEDLPSFLETGFIGGTNHGWDAPIGHPLAAYEVGEGLYLKAVYDGSKCGQDVRAMMTPHPATKRATVRKLSIGYRVVKSQTLKGLDECRVYWAKVGYTPTASDVERAQAGSVRLLIRIKLFEVSPVVAPANDRAAVTGVKGLESKSFADHSREVVSALRETREEAEALVERAEARVEARFKAGRELSRSNWDSLKELHDEHVTACESHRGMCGRLKAILDRTDPDSTANAEPASPIVDVDEAAVMDAYVKIMILTDTTAA